MNNYLFKEIWIKAPVEKVFACFTQAEAMLSWHGKEITLDPVPGGIYKVVFEDGSFILGEYKEVLSNQRVVYTANYNEVSSIITVTFTEKDGGTLLKLKQEFQPNQDIRPFDQGWDYFLGLLRDLWKENPT